MRHAFCNAVRIACTSKINLFISSQTRKFGAVIGNDDAKRIPDQHFMVVTGITCYQKSTQRQSPLIGEITYCPSFGGAQRQNVEIRLTGIDQMRRQIFARAIKRGF